MRLYWKQKLLPRIGAWFAKKIVRMLLFTCKVRVHGMDNLVQASAAGPTLLSLWHDRLAIIAEVLYCYAPPITFAAFVSQSRDGEILAKIATSYPNGRTIRVPHSGRDKALKALIHHLKIDRWVVLVTPDGPKGPPHQIKPGILFAAKEAGAQIIPISWKASQFWQMKTWDRMKIPKPFSEIDVYFGAPATHENLHEVME